MCAVETGGHEEGGKERVAAKGPFVMQKQLAVFIGLQRGKGDAQHDGDCQPADQVLAVVFMHQRMVRPCHGAARQQQDQRVDQRQVEGVHRVEDRRHVFRAHIFVHRVEGLFEEGPEPGDKEHHLGHDEQDEAIAQADAHDRSMIADVAFCDDVLPPGEHHVKHAHKAAPEQERCHVMHPQDSAEQHGKAADRADKRPAGRGENMVVVVLSMGHVPGSLLINSGLLLSLHQGRHSPRADQFRRMYMTG